MPAGDIWEIGEVLSHHDVMDLSEQMEIEY